MPEGVGCDITGCVKPSPSLIPNNLCAVGMGLAFTHTRNAHTLVEVPSTSGSVLEASQLETRQQYAIQSATACSVKGKQLLVLGHGTGMQVWDPFSMSLLYVWNQPSSAPPAKDHIDFVRGATSNVSADGEVQLCVGCSSGDIQVFNVSDGPSFKPSTTLSHHKAPILSLGSAYQSRRGAWTDDLTCELVSCDDEGGLAVWEADASGLYAVKREARLPSPATSVAVRRGMAICGCLDGTVRIYSVASLQLTTEIKAHSRWLSGMDIHPTKDLVATAAEDASVAVWQLPAAADGQVQNVLSRCCYNSLLTGVAFCGERSQHLAAISYDTDELHVWKAVAA